VHRVRAVSEDLDLDVAGRLDVTLDEHRAVAKGGERFVGRRVEVGLELVGRAHDAHAAAAAAEGRLADHRVSDLVAEGLSLRHRVHARLGARHDRHVVLASELARLGLVAKFGDDLGGRANKGDARLLAQLDELRVLREEAVAWVDGVHIVLHSDVDDLLSGEVRANGRLSLADEERLVGLIAVQRAKVLLGVDGDRLDVELCRSTEDTDGNLAAVGREDLADGPPARFRRWRRHKRTGVR